MSEPSHVEQLKQNRPLLVGVSLLSGAIGLIPLPLLPDLVIGSLRSWLLTHLAQKRQVTLTVQEARMVMAHLRVSPDRLASVAAALVGLRTVRRLARSLLLLLRFEDVVQTFLLGTYFDYYLVRYHQGEELSPEQAALVHQTADEALETAHMDVLSALFRKVVANLFSAGMYIPRTLWDLAASVIRGDEDVIEIEQDEDGQGFLRKAVGLLEQEMSSTGQITMEAICEGFDHAWIHVGGAGQVIPVDQPPTSEGEKP